VLLGIEFVEDRKTLQPANDAVRRIAARCEANGLIFQTRGVRDLHNVIRLVPPMTSSDAEVDRAMTILGDAIADAVKTPRRRR
jgi:4-aminobutyrate aminotransferase-like enzyme